MYEAALSWVKKDELNREESLPEVIVKVRLPLLTPQYLSDRVASEDLIKSSHKCRSVLTFNLSAQIQQMTYWPYFT